MASIYLIRHGQASFGAENYDELSALGRLQAKLTGEYLARTGVVFDAAYSGSLERQKDTAALALEGQAAPIPVIEDARLDEVRNDEHLEYLLPKVLETRPDIKAIVDQGLDSSKRFQKVIEAVFNYWVSPDCDEPAIQSWKDYSEGVHSMLEDIVRNQGGGKTVGVFTSGGTIATLTAAVLKLPGSATYQFYEPVFNCSVTQLFYSADRISLSYFNDCSFLRELSVSRGEKLVTYR
ncbi:histidine phosphatase family protein [Congregibacter litoralis]|uniref:Fructose-2,6-bisphosphatase n=1 Tax=Congregibacter litoralis KT71 TaxID=314285 RepID=A4A5Q6_9GAMM|nr:histidine phosphatase family protein [Congregibacter litoralis]EAQ98353.1 Fructose-2,6-bisphosphatase [Congregibacter litoralis KT71]